jgi:antitoxin PrlF
MPIATLTSKGQITLPRQIRDALKLRTGDRVEFVLGDEGIQVRAATSDVRELKGLLRRPGRTPVSLEGMDDAIARRGVRRR